MSPRPPGTTTTDTLFPYPPLFLSADLSITPREMGFGRDDRQGRWWLNGDPIASAFHTALSVTFPRGEAMFIEAVKAHRDGVPDRLAREIRAFTQQEVIHSREHVVRSEEHTSELQSLMRISYAVFCLKKKTTKRTTQTTRPT